MWLLPENPTVREHRLSGTGFRRCIRLTAVGLLDRRGITPRFDGSRDGIISEMPARSKITKALRLTLLGGMLVVELSLIAAFYVVPQFEARNTPAGHWGMETPLRNSSWLSFVLIAFLGVFALSNIGLVITIWRAVKGLKVND